MEKTDNIVYSVFVIVPDKSSNRIDGYHRGDFKTEIEAWDKARAIADASVAKGRPQYVCFGDSISFVSDGNEEAVVTVVHRVKSAEG